ncbi:MAG: L-aspartate oxidase [Actinobacteria bacterium]|nr:L-aspartate oxidase [Actinomycetota bacterium]
MTGGVQSTTAGEVVVVGAGSAGLYAAITAAREGARTLLVSQAPLASTASYWAQGGIAAALGPDDSADLHQADTLAAGRRAGRASAAQVLVQDSPTAVRDLIALGVDFDRDARGELARGLEGGHSRRRVVHAGGSATGRRITRELSAQAAEHPLITVVEHASAKALAIDDGRCVGVRVRIDDRDDVTLAARAVILATGGCAALWARSTNPPAAIGSGLTMAHAAGAQLADLEFLQFHPTALLSPSRNQGFLISEAIRGDGATLVDGDGERFVDELAPRDEVAAAVERRRTGADGRPAGDVFLDMREIDRVMFPNVFAKIEEAGFDPSRDLIPVAPAAHYGMGGVVTDLNARSRVPGLLAVGECACTGLHGANRLASNSLAECVVFGRRAALAALAEPALSSAARERTGTGGAWAEPAAPDPDPAATRDLLWRDAGIERDADGLRRLAASPNPLVRLIGTSAIAREETRGAHHRRDFPETDPALDFQHFVIGSDDRPRAERWE